MDDEDEEDEEDMLVESSVCVLVLWKEFKECWNVCLNVRGVDLFIGKENWWRTMGQFIQPIRALCRGILQPSARINVSNSKNQPQRKL